MPENFYHSLLDLDPEVVTPDYYQLLQLQPDEVLDAERVEQGYKAQMSKVQQVRSPRYKDLVEFLKGELKTARRTLSDEAARDRYEQEREAAARDKLRDVVIMFIQTSGNLSDIEVGEIHRRAKLVNLSRREADALIDELLEKFGCERVPATPEQMRRASEIMSLRASHMGKAEEEFAIQEDEHAKAQTAARGAPSAASSSGEGAALEAEAQRLQRKASRRRRAAPLRLVWRVYAGVAGVVVLLSALVVAAYVAVPEMLREPVAEQLGEGGVHLFYGENPSYDGAVEERDRLAGLLEEQEQAHTALQAEYQEAVRPRTPLELVQEAHAAGDLDEVRELVSVHADEEPEVAAYYRDVVEPWRLLYEPHVRWNLAEPGLTFRAPNTAAAHGGMHVAVPAEAEEALSLPFGAPVKAGIVSVRGRWRSEAAPFELAFFQPGPDGRSASDLTGTLAVDPRAESRAVTLTTYLDGEPLGERRVEIQLARGVRGLTGEEFELRLLLARMDDWPSTDMLVTRMFGIYEQPGVTGSDGRRTVSARLNAETSPGEWVGSSATGRLELRFAPGADVVLDEISVR